MVGRGVVIGREEWAHLVLRAPFCCDEATWAHAPLSPFFLVSLSPLPVPSSYVRRSLSVSPLPSPSSVAPPLPLLPPSQPSSVSPHPLPPSRLLVSLSLSARVLVLSPFSLLFSPLLSSPLVLLRISPTAVGREEGASPASSGEKGGNQERRGRGTFAGFGKTLERGP